MGQLPASPGIAKNDDASAILKTGPGHPAPLLDWECLRRHDERTSLYHAGAVTGLRQ
jgi:hypothetical protein